MPGSGATDSLSNTCPALSYDASVSANTASIGSPSCVMNNDSPCLNSTGVTNTDVDPSPVNVSASRMFSPFADIVIMLTLLPIAGATEASNVKVLS